MKDAIANSFRDAQGHRVPAFRAVWQAAETRHAASQRAYRRLAAAAAALAVILVSINLPAPQSAGGEFVQAADLLGSTSWVAPSDVLLPEHQFDIYQELPVLIESTKSTEGSLL